MSPSTSQRGTTSRRKGNILFLVKSKYSLGGDNIKNRGLLKGISYILILLVTSGSSIAIADKNQTDLALNESQISQMKGEKILVYAKGTDGQQKGMVEALVLIDAPAEIIWKIMTDCPGAPSFVPGLKDCRILDSGKNWEIIRHEVKWIWFLPRITYVFRAEYQINRQIDFVKTKGDLREMKGSWRLFPIDDSRQTIVRYEVYLDPSFFVPQWLVKRILMSDLPEMLAALRKKVQSSILDKKLNKSTYGIPIKK